MSNFKVRHIIDTLPMLAMSSLISALGIYTLYGMGCILEEIYPIKNTVVILAFMILTVGLVYTTMTAIYTSIDCVVEIVKTIYGIVKND